jgi:hypothetical protein
VAGARCLRRLALSPALSGARCLRRLASPRPSPEDGRREENLDPVPSPREAGTSHVDDDDAAIALRGVLVLGLPIAFAFALALALVLGLPALVMRRDLQPGLFLTPTLFLLAASDLFDDPGFEHYEDL